jgi:hypothetical protein
VRTKNEWELADGQPPNTKAPASGSGRYRLAYRKREPEKVKVLNYSSALAYELISQLRSISSCCGAVHSMVGSFEAR